MLGSLVQHGLQKINCNNVHIQNPLSYFESKGGGLKMKVIGRAHDSFWYLSELFQVPLPLLVDSNCQIAENESLLAKEIDIPGYITAEYTVQDEESIDSIASKLNIDVEILKLLNKDDNLLQLKKNTKILIPKRITDPIVNGRQNYSYETMMEHIRLLEEIYPFMKRNTIGISVQGKEIPELIIGYGRKKVHMNGSFHANEWITTAILMALLNDYLLSITNKTKLRGIHTEELYYSTTLSIVPMVNPDGVNLVLKGPPQDQKYRQFVLALNNGNDDFSGWKANINGVDLNKQFPALWEIEKPRKPKQPAPRDFPGYEPLTEPEAIAMAKLTKERNFDRVIAFHTQCKEIYWGFDDKQPPYAEVIVSEMAKQSGYLPVKTLDSYAGYKDWFIYEWKKPGFTVELGEGVNPLPISQFTDIYNDSLGLFLACLYM